MSFLNTIKQPAINSYAKSKILPSIVGAQAILESARGTSYFAREGNNLFGIKGDYNGQSITGPTQEWDGSKMITIDAAFRKYPNYQASIDDHGAFFTSTPWRTQNYAAVLNATDYKSQAQALQDAGYATDPEYANKLIRIIESEGLNAWDNELKGGNTMKIALDAGHGIHTPGKRSPAGEREWTFNNTVVRAAIAELNTYEGVTIVRLDDPTGNTDVSLQNRVRKAHNTNCDILVSVHQNALAGRWGNHGGTETYIPQGNATQSRQLANAVHPRLVRATGLRDRGIKTANLYMNRESNIPSILTEGAFMDSNTDIGHLRSAAGLKAQGVAIAQGIAAYGGLKKKSGGGSSSGGSSGGNSSGRSSSGTSNSGLYRVQVGAFSKKANADKLVREIKGKGHDAIVVKSGNLHRVQVGAYGKKANADAQLSRIKNLGYNDAFITGGGGGSTSAAKPKGKSISQMATEVLRGNHGLGHANRQRSLGVNNATYQKVRNEVNRRS